ncbi:unnamed protein product [Amoebophrya sp. A120]|nr:unnamed protein product [Amoebophrya sp. A120]|eukprot:GSA120T00020307001.1
MQPQVPAHVKNKTGRNYTPAADEIGDKGLLVDPKLQKHDIAQSTQTSKGNYISGASPPREGAAVAVAAPPAAGSSCNAGVGGGAGTMAASSSPLGETREQLHHTISLVEKPNLREVMREVGRQWLADLQNGTKLDEIPKFSPITTVSCMKTLDAKRLSIMPTPRTDGLLDQQLYTANLSQSQREALLLFDDVPDEEEEDERTPSTNRKPDTDTGIVNEEDKDLAENEEHADQEAGLVPPSRTKKRLFFLSKKELLALIEEETETSSLRDDVDLCQAELRRLLLLLETPEVYQVCVFSKRQVAALMRKLCVRFAKEKETMEGKFASSVRELQASHESALAADKEASMEVLQEADQAIQQMAEKSHALETQNETLQGDNARLQMENTRLLNDMERLKKEIQQENTMFLERIGLSRKDIHEGLLTGHRKLLTDDEMEQAQTAWTNRVHSEKETEMQHFKFQIAHLEDEMKRLKTEYDARLKQYHDSYQEQDKQIQALEQEKAEISKALDGEQERAAEKDAQLSAGKEECETLEKQKHEADAALQQKLERIAQLEKDLATSAAESGQREEAIHVLQKDKEELLEEEIRRKESLSVKAAEIWQLHQKLQDAKRVSERHEANYDAARTDNAKLRDELADLGEKLVSTIDFHLYNGASPSTGAHPVAQPLDVKPFQQQQLQLGNSNSTSSLNNNGSVAVPAPNSASLKSRAQSLQNRGSLQPQHFAGVTHAGASSSSPTDSNLAFYPYAKMNSKNAMKLGPANAERDVYGARSGASPTEMVMASARDGTRLVRETQRLRGVIRLKDSQLDSLRQDWHRTLESEQEEKIARAKATANLEDLEHFLEKCFPAVLQKVMLIRSGQEAQSLNLQNLHDEGAAPPSEDLVKTRTRQEGAHAELQAADETAASPKEPEQSTTAYQQLEKGGRGEDSDALQQHDQLFSLSASSSASGADAVAEAGQHEHQTAASLFPFSRIGGLLQERFRLMAEEQTAMRLELQEFREKEIKKQLQDLDQDLDSRKASPIASTPGIMPVFTDDCTDRSALPIRLSLGGHEAARKRTRTISDEMSYTYTQQELPPVIKEGEVFPFEGMKISTEEQRPRSFSDHAGANSARSGGAIDGSSFFASAGGQTVAPGAQAASASSTSQPDRPRQRTASSEGGELEQARVLVDNRDRSRYHSTLSAASQDLRASSPIPNLPEEVRERDGDNPLEQLVHSMSTSTSNQYAAAAETAGSSSFASGKMPSVQEDLNKARGPAAALTKGGRTGTSGPPASLVVVASASGASSSSSSSAKVEPEKINPATTMMSRQERQARPSTTNPSASAARSYARAFANAASKNKAVQQPKARPNGTSASPEKPASAKLADQYTQVQPRYKAVKPSVDSEKGDSVADSSVNISQQRDARSSGVHQGRKGKQNPKQQQASGSSAAKPATAVRKSSVTSPGRSGVEHAGTSGTATRPGQVRPSSPDSPSLVERANDVLLSTEQQPPPSSRMLVVSASEEGQGSALHLVSKNVRSGAQNQQHALVSDTKPDEYFEAEARQMGLGNKSSKKAGPQPHLQQATSALPGTSAPSKARNSVAQHAEMTRNKSGGSSTNFVGVGSTAAVSRRGASRDVDNSRRATPSRNVSGSSYSKSGKGAPAGASRSASPAKVENNALDEHHGPLQQDQLITGGASKAGDHAQQAAVVGPAQVISVGRQDPRASSSAEPSRQRPRAETGASSTTQLRSNEGSRSPPKAPRGSPSAGTRVRNKLQVVDTTPPLDEVSFNDAIQNITSDSFSRRAELDRELLLSAGGAGGNGINVNENQLLFPRSNVGTGGSTAMTTYLASRTKIAQMKLNDVGAAGAPGIAVEQEHGAGRLETCNKNQSSSATLAVQDLKTQKYLQNVDFNPISLARMHLDNELSNSKATTDPAAHPHQPFSRRAISQPPPVLVPTNSSQRGGYHYDPAGQHQAHTASLSQIYLPSERVLAKDYDQPPRSSGGQQFIVQNRSGGEHFGPVNMQQSYAPPRGMMSQHGGYPPEGAPYDLLPPPPGAGGVPLTTSASMGKYLPNSYAGAMNSAQLHHHRHSLPARTEQEQYHHGSYTAGPLAPPSGQNNIRAAVVHQQPAPRRNAEQRQRSEDVALMQQSDHHAMNLPLWATHVPVSEHRPFGTSAANNGTSSYGYNMNPSRSVPHPSTNVVLYEVDSASQQVFRGTPSRAVVDHATGRGTGILPPENRLHYDVTTLNIQPPPAGVAAPGYYHDFRRQDGGRIHDAYNHLNYDPSSRQRQQHPNGPHYYNEEKLHNHLPNHPMDYPHLLNNAPHQQPQHPQSMQQEGAQNQPSSSSRVQLAQEVSLMKAAKDFSLEEQRRNPKAATGALPSTAMMGASRGNGRHAKRSRGADSKPAGGPTTFGSAQRKPFV